MQRKPEPDAGDSRRLESWKEIAAYLDRSVRTVRRWEADEKLPVHRHQHAKGSTVFAQTGELDRWRRSRVAETKPPQVSAQEPEADAGPQPEVPPRPQAALSFRVVAATAGLALALALVALVRSMGDPAEPIDAWIRTIPVEQRLLLEAAYHGNRGAHEAALRAYEAVLGTGPLGREAVTAALTSCRSLDAPERCTELVVRAADRSGDDPTLLAMASQALATSAGRLDEAVIYAARSQASLPAGEVRLEPELASFVALLPARKAWLDGDIARSAAELDRVASRFGDLRGAARDAVAGAAGQHCLALGKIGCADDWFSRVTDPRLRHELQGYRLFAAGEMEALRAHLAAGGVEYSEIETAILLAMAGQTAAAEVLVTGFEQRYGVSGAEEVARGGLDLLAGHPMEALPRLEAGVAALSEPGSGIQFIGLDMLSRIAENRGELEHAVELLEMTSEQRTNSILRGTGLFWIKCQTRLADVYRSLDREADALRVERELLTVLALADVGHPTTTALRHRVA